MSHAARHLAAGWVELRRGDRGGRRRPGRRGAAARPGPPGPPGGRRGAAPAGVDRASRRRRRSPRSRGACGTTSATRSARPAPRCSSPRRAPARRARRCWPTAERLLVDAGAWGVPGRGPASSSAAAERRRRSPSSTLGGFRVTAHGTPVEVGDWGSRKARDLVKLLVARRGAPVVRDEVAAMLWPDEPDRSARRLSVLLSTIRGVLDPDKAYAARPLRRRRPRHGVARARARRGRRRAVPARGRRGPPAARQRRRREGGGRC